MLLLSIWKYLVKNDPMRWITCICLKVWKEVLVFFLGNCLFSAKLVQQARGRHALDSAPSLLSKRNKTMRVTKKTCDHRRLPGFQAVGCYVKTKNMDGKPSRFFAALQISFSLSCTKQKGKVTVQRRPGGSEVRAEAEVGSDKSLGLRRYCRSAATFSRLLP